MTECVRNRLPAIWVSISLLSSLRAPKTAPLVTLYSSCWSLWKTSLSPSMAHERADCCEPKTSSHIHHSTDKDWFPQTSTASSLSVISDVNTGELFKFLETTGWEYLQSDHRGCYSSTIFGSSLCHSQAWFSPTDPSLKASSTHPSQTDMALPPTAPREACHSNHWGGYGVLAALHHRHRHTCTMTE